MQKPLDRHRVNMFQRTNVAKIFQSDNLRSRDFLYQNVTSKTEDEKLEQFLKENPSQTTIWNHLIYYLRKSRFYSRKTIFLLSNYEVPIPFFFLFLFFFFSTSNALFSKQYAISCSRRIDQGYTSDIVTRRDVRESRPWNMVVTEPRNARRIRTGTALRKLSKFRKCSAARDNPSLVTR